MTKGEQVFEKIPNVQTEPSFIREVIEEPKKRNWLKKIWGKWPGEESIEELMAELKNRKT